MERNSDGLPSWRPPFVASRTLEAGLKRCPFCAEEIQDAAVVCRWCGRELAGESPADRDLAAGAERAERRLWQGRPALRSHLGKLALGLLLLAAAAVLLVLEPGLWMVGWPAVALGLALLGLAWIGVLRYRYELTTLRAFSREGLLSQSTSEIQLDDIRNVQQSRTFTERLLGLATISLSTAGQSEMEITFRSIGDAERVVQLVNAHND